MATKQQLNQKAVNPGTAIEKVDPPQAEGDPKFDKFGGLVFSETVEQQPKSDNDALARADNNGGLIMSKEVDAKYTDVDDADKDVVLPDVAPRWESLPEDEIKAHVTELTKWLRNQGATVNTMTITPGPGPFESGYSWRYGDGTPITIRSVHEDRLEALRGAASEAYHRRNEV